MRSLIIFFTSDSHGYIYPTNYADKQERRMGLLRIASEFEKDENTLMIDGGDTIQGSPFTYFAKMAGYSPCPVAEFMNAAKYDYITLGNHDFNYGVEYLGEYLRALDAKCLCANIRDKKHELPIYPYVIHTLGNGLRVGITGICTHYITQWERKETLDLLEIEEPVPAAARAFEQMRAEADVTICIYHGGFERDLNTGAPLTESKENQTFELCESVGFDAVLTGHQHISVPYIKIRDTVAAQPKHRAVEYIRLRADVDDDGSVVCSTETALPSEQPHDKALDVLAPVERRVQEWLDTVKGTMDEPLPVEDFMEMALHGSKLASFINTVQQEASGAQISATAFANEAGGIARDISIRGIVSAYPYSNTLVLLEMTGEQLKRYLENTAAYFDCADGEVSISKPFSQPKLRHFDYDHFRGMDYVIDIRKPVGSRVVSMKLQGAEIAPEQKVTVCVNNYRHAGSGGYDVLREARVIKEIQSEISELMIEYVETHPVIEPDEHRYITVLH